MRNSARNHVKVIIYTNCFSQTCMAAERAKGADMSANTLNVCGI